MILGLVFCFGPKVLAQQAVLNSETATEQNPVSSETSSLGASEELLFDEKVAAEDLNISDQTLLPTSPYYQLKNIWRNIKSTLTFNPVKKAELKLQYANEKLIEAKKVAETENNPEAVVKALKNYKEEINRLTKTVENFSEKTKENSGALAEKIIDNSVKQQKLIDSIEKGLSTDWLGQTNQVRNETVEQLGKTIVNMVPLEKIQELIETTLQNQTGSEFKDLKNLEVLKIVEQKLPEKAAEAVREVQKNILQKLETKVNSLQEQDKEKFQNYVENMGGNATAQLQVIEDLSKNELPEGLGQKLEKIKEQIMEKVEKLEQRQTQIANPASEYCVKMGGKLEMRTDENGGQFGICHLPDGVDCEEWALFRGECGKNSIEGGKILPEEPVQSTAPSQPTIPSQPRIIEPGEPDPSSLPFRERNKEINACIQVITPAVKDGICKEFPTPCDVPDDWSKVNACPNGNSNVQMERPVTGIQQAQPAKQIQVQNQIEKKPADKTTSNVSNKK